MDLHKFAMQVTPPWASQPCLYIIEHPASELTLEFPNGVYRMGASGTKEFKDSDRPFGSESKEVSGLISRSRLYLGFLEPLRAKIWAALRVKKQLVADPKKHRTATDVLGQEYNVDRGSYTLVLAREAEMHALLDAKDFRHKKDTKKELFVPTQSVQQLIAIMRKIKGEEMFVFDENNIIKDTKYRGGSENQIKVIQTNVRSTQDRDSKTSYVPTITLKLNKKAIEELQMMKPESFAQLADYILDVLEPEEIVRLSKNTVQELRQQTPAAVERVVNVVQRVAPLRRSARLARVNTRRSARLNSL